VAGEQESTKDVKQTGGSVGQGHASPEKKKGGKGGGKGCK